MEPFATLSLSYRTCLFWHIITLGSVPQPQLVCCATVCMQAIQNYMVNKKHFYLNSMELCPERGYNVTKWIFPHIEKQGQAGWECG